MLTSIFLLGLACASPLGIPPLRLHGVPGHISSDVNPIAHEESQSTNGTITSSRKFNKGMIVMPGTPLLARRSERKDDIPSPHVKYYGGPLISAATIVPIVIGKKGTIPAISTIKPMYWTFLFDRGSSFAKEYSNEKYQMKLGGVLPHVPVISTKQAFQDETDIANLLVDLVKTKKIVPTENTYFPIYLAPGVKVLIESDESCRDFCAFHWTLDISHIPGAKAKHLYYGECGKICGRSSKADDNLSIISAQLLKDAITNPMIGMADDLASPMGWYDENYGGVGDICKNTTTVKFFGQYTVRQTWIQSKKKCI